MVILIYNVVGEMKNQGMGVADLASSLMNIEQGVLAKAKDHYDLYGIGDGQGLRSVHLPAR